MLARLINLMKPLLVIIVGSVIGLGGLIFTSFFTPKFEDVRKDTAEKVTAQREGKPKPNSREGATLTNEAKAKASAPKVGKKRSKEDKKAQSERMKLVQNRRKKNG